MTLKEKIKAANDRPLKKIIVPEWDNAEIYVRTMTGGQRQRFEEKNLKGRDIILMMLAVCLCNADGTPIYTEEELDELGEKNLVVLGRLYGECDRINKVSFKGLDAAEGES